MGLLIVQILKWILRIILLLLLLLLILMVIVLVVPVRYQVEGGLQEKKPSVKGKVTWFFYLIYVKFQYADEFHIVLRILGIPVYDSAKSRKDKKSSKPEGMQSGEENLPETGNSLSEKEESVEKIEAQWEALEYEGQKVITEKIAENEVTPSVTSESNSADTNADSEICEIEEEPTKEKKSIIDKIKNIQTKIKDIIQKIRDIIQKIKNGKLKAEHYYELWKREETQITFLRCKKKLLNMIKAVFPRKWNLTGEVGFEDPCTTGQMMGVLGMLYPVLGNKVQLCPNFERQIINIEGYVKGHIRIGNLVYQVVSLLLNKYCFAFIKLIFDEVSNTNKQNKQEV